MSKLKSDANAIIAIGMIMICILAIVLLITGCRTVENRTDIYATSESVQQIYTTFNNPVSEPSDIKYLVPNALSEVSMEKLPKVESPRAVSGPKHTLNYPVYSGLKSREIQEKVNSQIQSVIFEIGKQLDPKTIVPFRGIKKIINDKSTLSDSYISLYTSFSANNILSVRAYGSGTYKASVEAFKESTWVSIAKGLTIDLNTGENVPLEALFVDGYDYESAINDAIAEQIGQSNLMDEAYMEYTYFPARLTKPFDGIKPDQPYILDQFNLTIIIDANDARFDSGFDQATFSITLAKFGENLAIDKRYFELENNLFIDETERRSLPEWKAGGHGRSYNYNGTFEGGTWFLMAYIQGDQSEQNDNNSDDKLDAIYDALIADSKVYLNGLKIEGKDNHVEMTLSKVMYGRYASIFKSLWLANGNDYSGTLAYLMYDVSGKQLTLDDLFIEGFEYEPILNEQIGIKFSEIGQFTDQEIATMFAAKSFTLNQSSVTIHLPLPDLRTGTNFYQVDFPFEIFGVRNMTIFD
jgi:hypothetical protein